MGRRDVMLRAPVRLGRLHGLLLWDLSLLSTAFTRGLAGVAPESRRVLLVATAIRILLRLSSVDLYLLHILGRPVSVVTRVDTEGILLLLVVLTKIVVPLLAQRRIVVI